MRQIHVAALSEHAFTVTVTDGGSTTEHKVTVPDAMATDYEGREGELVRRSFEFLLEREPPSSIMQTFSLDVISRYFPEYPAEIKGRMA